MEINNTRTLVEYIQSTNAEDGEVILKQFQNAIAEQEIERAWEKIRRYICYSATERKARIKRYKMNFDEESGYISLSQFNKFFQYLDNTAKEHAERGNEEVADAMADLMDGCENFVGDIRLDFRLALRKED